MLRLDPSIHAVTAAKASDYQNSALLASLDGHGMDPCARRVAPGSAMG